MFFVLYPLQDTCWKAMWLEIWPYLDNEENQFNWVYPAIYEIAISKLDLGKMMSNSWIGPVWFLNLRSWHQSKDK